jgi:hypothetical protein
MQQTKKPMYTIEERSYGVKITFDRIPSTEEFTDLADSLKQQQSKKRAYCQSNCKPRYRTLNTCFANDLRVRCVNKATAERIQTLINA